MKKTELLVLLSTLSLCFLFADAVSQGGYQAYCGNYIRHPGERIHCSKIHRPVCGTDGKTYNNRCEFCRVAWEMQGKLGYKHEGKC
ncbi:serine protease inhibitor Kazal-type 12-like [Ornithorhynchus anatinus]|uniref:Kazal-like domain-containing protein n=1 Tax=Ornithorhynchus anatinus TaxID=9258 RepID=F6Z2V8_ORNAN|nr:serine protease inhibitor Kazal-type 12-like [Ornithorhynchus anatinus]